MPIHIQNERWLTVWRSFLLSTLDGDDCSLFIVPKYINKDTIYKENNPNILFVCVGCTGVDLFEIFIFITFDKSLNDDPFVVCCWLKLKTLLILLSFGWAVAVGVGIELVFVNENPLVDDSINRTFT